MWQDVALVRAKALYLKGSQIKSSFTVGTSGQVQQAPFIL